LKKGKQAEGLKIYWYNNDCFKTFPLKFAKNFRTTKLSHKNQALSFISQGIVTIYIGVLYILHI
jgi:hypothetical protein